jgi:hypothetical protein
MDIPTGNTRDDNKARRQIIKEFYANWMAEHPEKRVWNKSLNAFINVKNASVNEALGHAPRSLEATSAQMHLSEILSEATYVGNRPPKYGDKNQKRFSRMLFLRWNASRVLVGQRKTSGEYDLYYISGGQKKSRQVTALEWGSDQNLGGLSSLQTNSPSTNPIAKVLNISETSKYLDEN